MIYARFNKWQRFRRRVLQQIDQLIIFRVPREPKLICSPALTRNIQSNLIIPGRVLFIIKSFDL